MFLGADDTGHRQDDRPGPRDVRRAQHEHADARCKKRPQENIEPIDATRTGPWCSRALVAGHADSFLTE